MLFKLTNKQSMMQSIGREFSRNLVAVTASERDKSNPFLGKLPRRLGKWADLQPESRTCFFFRV